MGRIQFYRLAREMFGIKEREEPNRLENIREYLAHKLDADIRVQKIVQSPLYPVYMMQPVRKSAR